MQRRVRFPFETVLRLAVLNPAIHSNHWGGLKTAKSLAKSMLIWARVPGSKAFSRVSCVTSVGSHGQGHLCWTLMPSLTVSQTQASWRRQKNAGLPGAGPSRLPSLESTLIRCLFGSLSRHSFSSGPPPESSELESGLVPLSPSSSPHLPQEPFPQPPTIPALS